MTQEDVLARAARSGRSLTVAGPLRTRTEFLTLRRGHHSTFGPLGADTIQARPADWDAKHARLGAALTPLLRRLVTA